LYLAIFGIVALALIVIKSIGFTPSEKTPHHSVFVESNYTFKMVNSATLTKISILQASPNCPHPNRLGDVYDEIKSNTNAINCSWDEEISRVESAVITASDFNPINDASLGKNEFLTKLLTYNLSLEAMKSQEIDVSRHIKTVMDAIYFTQISTTCEEFKKFKFIWKSSLDEVENFIHQRVPTSLKP
jgi:hypothetical protein